MRKIIHAASVAVCALALTACGGAAEDTTGTEEVAAVDDVADAAGEASGVLDASTASAEELAAIEGVSAELAAAIVAGQPYTSVVDLHDVLTASLSPEEAAAVLESVFVPINLNTATDAEIALVPGMDEKMAHEFEEYRPYEDLAEFDREIGKYVDEAEVARFRQYVTL